MRKEKINSQFVLLYAIGITLVVGGHISTRNYLNLFSNFFPTYSFHLALFAFCSGYFYKAENENVIGTYILKKFKKTIIPLYFWNIMYGLFVQITRIKQFKIGGDLTLYNIFISPLKSTHQFIYNLATWFLVPLFEVFNVIIRKITKRLNINDYIYFIIYLLLGVFSVYLAYNGYRTGWFLLIDRTLYLLPFYGLGTLYRSKLEKRDTLNNYLYFIIILSIDLILITLNNGAIDFTPSWCNDYTNNYLMPFIVGVLAIAFWLRISRILSPIASNSQIVKLVGTNTFPIMVHQFFGFFVVKCFFAIGSKFIPIFNSFNWNRFKTDIWYYYIPKGLKQWLIIYALAGIFIPILINFILKKIFSKNKKFKFLDGILYQC